MAVLLSTLGGGSDGVRNANASLCWFASVLVSSSDRLDGVAGGRFRGVAVGSDVEAGAGWGTAWEQARASNKTKGKPKAILVLKKLIMIPTSLGMSPRSLNDFLEAV